MKHDRVQSISSDNDFNFVRSMVEPSTFLPQPQSFCTVIQSLTCDPAAQRCRERIQYDVYVSTCATEIEASGRDILSHFVQIHPVLLSGVFSALSIGSLLTSLYSPYSVDRDHCDRSCVTLW